MSVATRKAAWSSATPPDGWSDDLRWYAAAIHQMRRLTPRLDDFRPAAFEAIKLFRVPRPNPAQLKRREEMLAALSSIIRDWKDPSSLGYQAQVHATFMNPDDWPTFKHKKVLWTECAHSNWFFLPWHRAYLLEFEAVAREHIKDLGGPHKEWALPYWNSSDYLQQPEAATLPLALRDELLPAGVTITGLPKGSRANPLFEPSRKGPDPLPATPSAADWPDASAALKRPHYANAQDDNAISFGGGYIEDLDTFHNGDEIGQVDVQPHGAGHVEIGGFMSSFLTAGLDPVFWMHHANVDRLWETYARDLKHGYPFPNGRPAGGVARDAFDSWSTRPYRFLLPSGKVESWTAPMLLDVRALGYQYDRTDEPTFNPVPPNSPGAEIDPFGFAPLEFTPVAAASDVEVAGPTTIVLAGEGGAAVVDALGANPRWVVRFDGIRSREPAEITYAVYIGDDGPAAERSGLLGALTLFGVFESTIASNGEVGRARIFEASSVVADLPSFDPAAVQLTLVPTTTNDNRSVTPITVERVSIDVA